MHTVSSLWQMLPRTLGLAPLTFRMHVDTPQRLPTSVKQWGSGTEWTTPDPVPRCRFFVKFFPGTLGPVSSISRMHIGMFQWPSLPPIPGV